MTLGRERGARKEQPERIKLRESMREAQMGSRGRQDSRGKIGAFIYHRGKTSKQEISRELGLSMPTVLQCVGGLIREQILEESGEYQSTGGRKAKQISVRRDFHYAVGVDVTERHQSFVLLDGRGEKAAAERVRKRFVNTEAYWKELAEVVHGFRKREGISPEKFLGVGMSLPCIVDPERQMILRSHVLRLEQMDLRPVAEMLDCPVRFWNDANSAAYGELHGEARNAVYLSLSNTVGGAMYMNESVHMGDHFRAGEFGHMVLVPGGRRCYCGKRGCVDAYCSAKALCGDRWEQLEVFFEALERREERAEEAWEEYLENLALAVTNLRMAYDCDIVLGGYVGSCLAEYRDRLEEKMAQWNLFDMDGGYLRFGRRGKEAAAVGAARQLMDEFWEEL